MRASWPGRARARPSSARSCGGPGCRGGVGAVLGQRLNPAAPGAARAELRLGGGSPAADGAPAAAGKPGRDAVAPDVAARRRPLAGLVEVVAELSGPAGDRGEETLDADLVTLKLLLLPSVGRVRARRTSSSDRIGVQVPLYRFT